ncbi:uncharacterized protein DSM5745_02439 [Aspergillus mulundensis]|uniref:Uncharacterized protein n=1 Tax=Aspergillus mulundensis TaxID=1810919 RepID=A0A3D8SWK9_9EURO|nr:hypothetical protein DSM5745_02439 [Aspergillus mulundensis]RDW90664.1 hypothetical protein DSM5745_02439 [Aspergillus mulundensis]
MGSPLSSDSNKEGFIDAVEADFHIGHTQYSAYNTASMEMELTERAEANGTSEEQNQAKQRASAKSGCQQRRSTPIGQDDEPILDYSLGGRLRRQSTVRPVDPRRWSAGLEVLQIHHFKRIAASLTSRY